jgi:hypothetical protein
MSTALFEGSGTVEVRGYPFGYVCDIDVEREADGSVRRLMPQGRYKNLRGLARNKYGAGPFCKFKVSGALGVAGVYLFVVEGAVRYVGECANLARRFNMGYGNISPRNCFKGGQETNCRVNHLVYNTVKAGKQVSLWFFRTRDYKTVEKALRLSLNAKWNRA